MAYRNIDMRGPERVRITWEMVTEPDDSQEAPDERADGFWPSKDPDAAGYVKPENYDKETRKAAKRMAAWRRGTWFYCGIIARAVIHIPIGGGSYTIHVMDSAGLWGIESDDDAYHRTVFEQEKAELLAQLKTLGAAIIDGTAEQKG